MSIAHYIRSLPQLRPARYRTPPPIHSVGDVEIAFAGILLFFFIPCFIFLAFKHVAMLVVWLCGRRARCALLTARTPPQSLPAPCPQPALARHCDRAPALHLGSGIVENVTFNSRSGMFLRFARHRWDEARDRSNRLWNVLFQTCTPRAGAAPLRHLLHRVLIPRALACGTAGSRRWDGSWFNVEVEMPPSVSVRVGSQVEVRYCANRCCVRADVQWSRQVGSLHTRLLSARADQARPYPPPLSSKEMLPRHAVALGLHHNGRGRDRGGNCPCSGRTA